jgi:hypothetical protein
MEQTTPIREAIERQWAENQSLQWEAALIWGAAANGHLTVQRWTRKHECPWDEWTRAQAAESGHVQ